MTRRPHESFATGAVVACALVGGIAFVVAAAFTPGRTRTTSGGNDLGNPPGMTDRLDLIDTPELWGLGRLEHVNVRSGAQPSLLLDEALDRFPRAGTWTSAETRSAFPFTELIPSWNVSAPAGTGLRLEVRVRSTRGDWSPWLFLGSWGRTSEASELVLACSFGAVNVDYLALDRPADAYQVRVVLESFSLEAAATPAVRRVAVCYSGVTGGAPKRLPVEGWARNLPVPFRTQRDAPKPLEGEICSPTSLTMVLAFWGVDRPVVENALAVYDSRYGIFGNWGRAVARAGELGMDAWVTRFRSWDAVKASVAAGRPVIASIRFEPGQFPSAVLPSTDGHLIVIRGFTPGGDVIVNDPASRERGDGIVYRAEELARAWFDHGGVGYVISPSRVGILSSAVK